MRQQLHFEGDQIFEPPTIHEIMDELFVKEIRAAMAASSPLFHEDLWRLQPAYEVQTLFEPAPRCGRYVELGDDTLWCNYDAGHAGNHYDAMARIEWSQR